MRFQYGRQITLNRDNDLWCTNGKTPPVQGDERRRWLTGFNTVPSILPIDNGSYVYMYQADGTPVVSELSQVEEPVVRAAVVGVQAQPLPRPLPLLSLARSG